MDGRPTSVLIGRRFNGPPGSANGGYACGLLAGLAAGRVDGPVAVTLHRPPPLDTPLEVRGTGRRVHLWAGEDLVAGAAATTVAWRPFALPGPEQLRSAEAGYPADRFHPFPTCFVCGTRRPADDGLMLRPGPLPGRGGEVGCSWTPGRSLGPEGSAVPEPVVWGALDCPCGWTSDLAAQPMVLTWMTALVTRRPVVGHRYTVVARGDSRLPRTASMTSAILEPSTGAVLARAATIWTAVNL